MSRDGRPDPDQLLAHAREEERRKQRGRLKIFFGAAPGVGKTFAMLEAALREKERGVDVVAGVVETHGRAETEALLKGLDILPRRRIAHRGIELSEFDPDAALARRPALLLVDELAHTNAPGMRQSRRWLDVFELLDEGLDVWTTLNVQHIDSLNDVVAQITGVVVRETVPDSVLDRADEVELVDLPAEELIARMEAGKVYLPEQAERARANFFRRGNLIALRELALRRTADRVDSEMRAYRAKHSIQENWPVRDRMLVLVGPSPYSARLIRATARLAMRLDTEWTAVVVETPSLLQASEEVRQRVQAALRLAREMGGEAVTLGGADVALAVLEFARSRNISRIIVGRSRAAGWRNRFRRSILSQLLERSGEIEILVTEGDAGAAVRSHWAGPEAPRRGDWSEAAQATALIAAATVVSLPLRGVLEPANLLMLYLLALVGVALRATRKRVAVFASLLSVAAFDFFCVPPYLTFAVTDTEFLLVFGTMLVVAVTLTTLAVRLREQAAEAASRAARTLALYQLTRRLASAQRRFDAARDACAIAEETFRAPVAIFLPDERGRLDFSRRTSDALPVASSEEAIAQWAMDHLQPAGRWTSTLPGAKGLYLPLNSGNRCHGVLVFAAPAESPRLPAESMSLLEAFATQTGLALERTCASEAAREAQVRAEAEQLRSSLLSAVSHDLRTPLASITGASATLLDEESRIEPEVRRGLIESIHSEADRLATLVRNLLDMTRLDAGSVQLKAEIVPVEEVVGSALSRAAALLGTRPVRVNLPESLPAVLADPVLLEQLFVNLLENAARHTPRDCAVEVEGRGEGDRVLVELSDHGPGIAPGLEERIFDKFVRGDRGGAGLGLAICRSIAIAHNGSITAENRPGGGARFRVKLPAARPPEMEREP